MKGNTVILVLLVLIPFIITYFTPINSFSH